jgi:hypothetical protein
VLKNKKDPSITVLKQLESKTKRGTAPAKTSKTKITKKKTAFLAKGRFFCFCLSV